MVIGWVAFVILLVLLVQADRADHDAIFYPRPYGYCEQGVYWDRRINRFRHDDGSLEGAPYGPGSINHWAHPGGTLS